MLNSSNILEKFASIFFVIVEVILLKHRHKNFLLLNPVLFHRVKKVVYQFTIIVSDYTFEKCYET
jgi:hypothetical protein